MNLKVLSLMNKRSAETIPEKEKLTNNPRFPPTEPISATNGMTMYSSWYVMTSGESKSYATTNVGFKESASLSLAISFASPWRRNQLVIIS